MPKVIVTGATGYLAQYVINNFLDEGYKVIGTVRSKEKGDSLSEKYLNPSFSYGIIEDLTNSEQVNQLVKTHSDVEYFIHTAAASNLFTNDSENDILLPNINGTKIILKALSTYAPCLKKFVYTSSISAFNTNVMGFDPFDEDSWNQVTYEQGKLNGFFGYSASKKYSEKAIFEFIEIEKPKWGIVTIGLSMVLGEPFFKGDGINNSAKFLLKSLKATTPGEVEESSFLTVDVLDAAKAHFIAATNDDIKNERLLVSCNRLTPQDVLDAGNEIEKLKGKIVIGTPRTTPIDLKTNVNSSKSVKLLGFEPGSTLSILKKVIQYCVDEKQYGL